MHLIARIIVTNSSKTNQKRIINKFSTSYLLARNASSTQQQQNEKTVEELTKENGNLIAELRQQKQDFEARIAQLQKEKEEFLKLFGKKLAEEDKQIVLPIHEMKVRLPSDEWYTFATQIGDRRLSDNLKSFMHEHEHGDGDITLGRMEIIPPRDDVPSDCPMVQLQGRHRSTAVYLPDSPMPANVKNFDEITTTYVDMDVVAFLRKFQENNLLANVQLDLSFGAKFNTIPMLKKVLPLISSIYSLKLPELFDWIYDNDEYGYAKEIKPLLKTMVTQTKILSFRWSTYDSTKCTWEDKIDWCCSWLYTPRDDGMPLALISEYYCEEDTNCYSFIDRIKKDFLEANHPVSFYIRLNVPENFQLEISLDNEKTNEKLVVKAQAGKHDKISLLISRHSSNADKNKIEEEEKEISKYDHFYGGPRRIHLTHDWSGY